MFSRQFINLVMKDFRGKGSYCLSRMMPEGNLFYPSAVEAVAAQAQAKKEKTKKSPPFTSTRDLPPPVVRFKSSSRQACMALEFMPFYGRDSEGKIVAVDLAGQTVLYDADAADDDDVGSIEMLPRLNASKWRSIISMCVTQANASGAEDSSPSDVLYAINTTNSNDFEALVYCNPSGIAGIDDGKAWHWLNLPQPPYIDDPDCYNRTIHSCTLLGDGKTICFSSVPHDGGFGTYCFDTSRHEWTKVGGWVLPFFGRALHVPELHGLWFGFLDDDHHNLCAVDLSSLDSAPEVLHEWRGFNPPEDWLLLDDRILYLGANRFCVAKTFGIYNGPPEECDELVDTATVFTGVEIVNGQRNKAMLRMVKHKSLTVIFDGCGIESVL